MKKMDIKIIYILAITLFVSLTSCSKHQEKIDLSFNKTEMSLFQLNDGQMAIKIIKNKEVVLDTSAIGIVIDTKLLGVNASIKKLPNDSIHQNYALHGVKSKVEYKAVLNTFQITQEDGFKWHLEVQMSDEGVAYRYLIPNDGIKKVNEELTTFKLPTKTKVWYFERDSSWKLKSFAGEWRSADIAEIPKVSKMGPIQGLTLTCELPNRSYALLAEAALYNYSGMRLKAIGNNSFKANFTEGKKGFEINGLITTPWRCILLADNLNDLVNNTMVASLNPAPDKKLFEDTSWIKPGKSVWSWWSNNDVNFNTEMKMVDDAAALNFKYAMIDEGWELWEGNKWERIKEIATKAKQNGVGIFVWKHSKELNLPENDYQVMRSFLDSVKNTGAVGLKVDFMNGQSKSIIAFDEALLKQAAKRQLMVNFHGCQQSSGEYRTYPNEVAREGVRGMELNHMKEGPLPASHNASLPFTRFATGHADYTPLGFTAPGETSWAHQLGTLVCFYSTFTCIAENTQFMLNTKEIKPALEFIKNVPAVWDETLVLSESKLGELAVIARRKGTDWFLGVLNGGKEKEIVIDCNFLANINYKTTIFTDDIVAKPINLEGIIKKVNLKGYNTVIPFKREEQNSAKNSKITIRLAENGGSAIWFSLNDSPFKN